jgi:hypothetical protein
VANSLIKKGCNKLQLEIFDTQVELGQVAAIDPARIINHAIIERGGAYVIAATGASQSHPAKRFSSNQRRPRIL